MTTIQVKGVDKKFESRGGAVWALKGVSLEIEAGEMLGLLGPNGSGKTTLINIILTILIPDRGEVRIFGKDPFVERDVLRRLNFIPASRPFSNLKVREFLSCYARIYSVPVERSESLLKELGLERLARVPCWTLSTGEMTLLMLAKAILNNPKLLLLDEPMMGLDPKMRGRIGEILRDLNGDGVTILFATQDMEVAERLATKIAFIKGGRILDVQSKERIVNEFENVEGYWLELERT